MAWVIDYDKYEDFGAQFELAKSKCRKRKGTVHIDKDGRAIPDAQFPHSTPAPLQIASPTIPKQTEKPKSPELNDDAPLLRNRVSVSPGPGASLPSEVDQDIDGVVPDGEKLAKAIKSLLEQAANLIGPLKAAENTTEAQAQTINQLKMMQKQVAETNIIEEEFSKPEASKKKGAASKKTGKKTKTTTKGKKSVKGKLYKQCGTSSTEDLIVIVKKSPKKSMKTQPKKGKDKKDSEPEDDTSGGDDEDANSNETPSDKPAMPKGKTKKGKGNKKEEGHGEESRDKKIDEAKIKKIKSKKNSTKNKPAKKNKR